MPDREPVALFLPAAVVGGYVLAYVRRAGYPEPTDQCLHETPTATGRWVCVLPKGHPPTDRKDGHG